MTERSGQSTVERENIFAPVYEEREQPAWGSQQSRSGTGSELAATENLRLYLPELFSRLTIRTVLDAPCGDWNWMRNVNLSGVDYTGVDVVSSIVRSNSQWFSRSGVRFVHADIAKDELPTADLILCRDCWVHLSFADIAAVLENFRRSGATWLLASNSPTIEKNRNQDTGLNWRYLNLHRAPFYFPVPMETRKDHYPQEPFAISLWRIEHLPQIQIWSSRTSPQGHYLRRWIPGGARRERDPRRLATDTHVEEGRGLLFRGLRQWLKLR